MPGPRTNQINKGLIKVEGSMEINDFLKTLESYTGKQNKKSGSRYSACCPAHGDDNPSLSIRETCDGEILLKCFAGCSANATCSALRLEMSDLFDLKKLATNIFGFLEKNNFYCYAMIEMPFSGITRIIKDNFLQFKSNYLWDICKLEMKILRMRT